MKSFLLSSLLILLFSCKSGKVPLATKDADCAKFRTYLDSSITSIKYKADVTVYGRYLSGILYFKFSDDTTCRAAMVTITGATLFDLQITPKTSTVYSSLQQLSKPVVLKAIEKNIRTFTMLDDFQNGCKTAIGSDFKGLVWERYTSEQIWQFYQPDGEVINQVEVYDKKYKKKMTLKVLNSVKNSPSEVDIKNHNFKLQIHLTQL